MTWAASSVVEHLTFNQGVAGSIPARPTSNYRVFFDSTRSAFSQKGPNRVRPRVSVFRAPVRPRYARRRSIQESSGRWALPPPVPLGGTDESSVDAPKKRRLLYDLGRRLAASSLRRQPSRGRWSFPAGTRLPTQPNQPPGLGLVRADANNATYATWNSALRASNSTKVTRSLPSGSALTPSSGSTREHAHDDRTVASRSSHIF